MKNKNTTQNTMFRENALFSIILIWTIFKMDNYFGASEPDINVLMNNGKETFLEFY